MQAVGGLLANAGAILATNAANSTTTFAILETSSWTTFGLHFFTGVDGDDDVSFCQA